MKKILNLFAMALLGVPSIFAQEPTFAEFPDAEFFNRTGGPQVTALSRNGRWASGSTYHSGGFVYDVKEGTFRLGGGGRISDLGDMAAGGSVYNFITGETTPLERGGNYAFSMTTDISADGRIVTGMVGPDWTNLRPCYWEEGAFKLLPFPDSATVKTFKVNGCQARWVSGDGSVIVGYLVANPNTNTMIVWVRQDDGSYRYIDTWSEFYEPQHGLVYDYDRKEYDFVKGPNPWMRMEPAGITADGTTVALYLQDNRSNELAPPHQLGFYHIKSGRIEACPYNPDDQMGDAREFVVCGITDNLTVCGITGSLDRDPKPFIKYYGEDPRYLNDVFPEFERLEDYDALRTSGMPYLCTGISRDGGVIVGYATMKADFTDDDGTVAENLGFMGFAINTGSRRSAYEKPEEEENAVETVQAGDDGSPEYFSLDGRRVASPSPGIYIERRSGKKIIIRN